MRRSLKIISSALIISLLVFERCAYNDINIQFDCGQSTLAIDLHSRERCYYLPIDRWIDNRCGKVVDWNRMTSTSMAVSIKPTAHSKTSAQELATIRVKDMNGCWKAIDVTINAAGIPTLLLPFRLLSIINDSSRQRQQLRSPRPVVQVLTFSRSIQKATARATCSRILKQ